MMALLSSKCDDVDTLEQKRTNPPPKRKGKMIGNIRMTEAFPHRPEVYGIVNESTVQAIDGGLGLPWLETEQ